MEIIRSAGKAWVDSQEASIYLGFSEKTLKCWCDCGYLKAGKHWRRSSQPSNDSVIYNTRLCAQEMKEWWGRDALTGP